MKGRFFIVAALIGTALFPSHVFGQAAEINPYVGFYWPSSGSGVGTFQNNQLLGVRGGYYLTPGFEVGGNYSWSNHFQPTSASLGSSFAGSLGFPQGTVRANIWELEFSYNFGKRRMFRSNLRPYIIGGAGGLTTNVTDPDAFVLNVRPFVIPGNTLFVTNDVLSSSQTFFTFSYGVGFKNERIWGPMGIFGDARGRSVPNFFSSSLNWPELSAGLTFSFGER
jgi:Outer membrane protein beta-barrel domain